MSTDRRVKNEEGKLVFPDRLTPWETGELKRKPSYSCAYHNPPAAADLREAIKAHNESVSNSQATV